MQKYKDNYLNSFENVYYGSTTIKCVWVNKEKN